MLEKWMAQNEKVLNTSIWLKFERANCNHVLSLKCTICSQFNDELASMWNYHQAFIEGMTNVRTSSLKEHGATDMHACAMVLFKKQQSIPHSCWARHTWNAYNVRTPTRPEYQVLGICVDWQWQWQWLNSRTSDWTTTLPINNEQTKTKTV